MIQADPSPCLRHRLLVDAIERECRVDEWRAGDIDLWPIASQDLFLDLFRQEGRDTAPPVRPFAVRAAGSLAVPATNLWKSRHDLRNWVPRARRADAVLLGDGVSLDHLDGVWRDRFGEPVLDALERQGRRCFVMQSGNLARLPWARPTYAANQIAAAGALGAALSRGPKPNLPDHDAALRLMQGVGVKAPSVTPEALARRARAVAAQAKAFDRILRRVRPSVAFVVTYYAGLGHAFALACRRRGILCVDLQHCRHGDRHRAYHWWKLPGRGYSTLPGLFWTWGESDAAQIRRWANRSTQPWHRAIAGGHTQLLAMGGTAEAERLWHEALSVRGDGPFDREILVALQPIGGRREIWDALANAIERAPPSWRWWIRRHPSSTAAQDKDYARLLMLDRRNVVSGEAAQIPLPALLAHMDAVVSLASGTAGEAAVAGVPAFFLDEEAYDTFPSLIAGGQASVVCAAELQARIVKAERRSPAATAVSSMEHTLGEIDRLAKEYRALVARSAG